MKRSTALMAQLRAQSKEGTSLHFEGALGGHFSDRPEYALRVCGRTEKYVPSGNNLFPLGDLLRESGWANPSFSSIMSDDELSAMLEPDKVYTLSFDAECLDVPSETVYRSGCCVDFDSGAYIDCGELSLEEQNMALGFVLVHDSAQNWYGYGLDLPESEIAPNVVMYVDHKMQKGEKYRGVVTFTTPDSLDGYSLYLLTNQHYYSHYSGPELCYSTVSLTNIRIEEGETATPEGDGDKCVRAGSDIVCGNCRATLPCDLQDGDVWYVTKGIVERHNGQMERYEPCSMVVPSGTVDITQNALELEARLGATLLVKGEGESMSWKEIQGIVRCGLADRYFKIGDQLTVDRDGQKLVFDVIGIDHDTPVDKNLKHSLTLQLHDIFSVLAFDGTEALFCAEEGLAPGTYNFTLLSGHDVANGGGKTYSFTLENPVLPGGVVTFPWGADKQAADTKVSTYDSVTSTVAVETVPVTEGANGTALETIGECNHTHRIRYGSNSWLQSAMRQYINSGGQAGEVWTPQTKFDRPPTWSTTAEGFLRGFDPEFLEVVGKVQKTTTLVSVDGVGTETTSERFFLLSRPEVYGGYDGKMNEGTAYPYYAESSNLTSAGAGTDANRVKLQNGEAQHWWLRTPHPDNAYYVRYIFSTRGSVANSNPYNGRGVAPACCIV